jgi:dienelactone hydrolase
MIRYALTALMALVVLQSPGPAGAGTSVTYEVAGVSYEGYFAPAGKEAPLILLIHDWDGLTDYEVKRADMLADAGYSVFAADLFGKGVRPTKVEDKRQHTGELYSDREKMRELMFVAFKEARAQGADEGNAVCMGYCFGGAAALELARTGMDLKGFVTFHGGLSTPNGQDYSETSGEILVLHGTADTLISMEKFASLATALEEASVPHEMITYGAARHAFTVFGQERYNEAADEKSWSRFMKFLERMLGE